MTTANYGFLGKISIHESVIKTLGKHGFAHPMSSDKSTTDLLLLCYSYAGITRYYVY